MKRYFITGTDTDCGKTYVTCQLLDYFPNSAALKPVASGCIKEHGEWVNSDAKLIQKHNFLDFSLHEINPWRFPLPISPHIAAREAGVELSLTQLTEYCLKFNRPELNTLFIEGAGGLLAPLNNQYTWLEFLKVTQIPVILVVGIKLGCINHALLTEKVLRASSIHCAGWIANCLDPEMLFRDDSIETIKEKLSCPLLTTINFNGTCPDFAGQL